jgi:DNA-directed RNA polymerase subunit RPC12/RpoP
VSQLILSTNPIHVRCRLCGYRGAIPVQLPIAMERFIELLHTARCASCGSRGRDLLWDEPQCELRWAM